VSGDGELGMESSKWREIRAGRDAWFAYGLFPK
jgi:hypothetical protein